jgi:hypothetical protein
MSNGLNVTITKNVRLNPKLSPDVTVYNSPVVLRSDAVFNSGNGGGATHITELQDVVMADTSDGVTLVYDHATHVFTTRLLTANDVTGLSALDAGEF